MVLRREGLVAIRCERWRPRGSPGSIVVITEGRKTVAYFPVDELGAADT
jgi:hypothetical protein